MNISDPMDLSMDLIPEFSPEECAKREIAYTIATLAFAFFKREEFLYSSEGKYRFNGMHPQFSAEISIEKKEHMGDILMPTITDLEPRPIYSLGKRTDAYFALSMALKYVTKEFLLPRSESKIPIINEIWSHFHRILKEFSCSLYTPETWKQNVKIGKERLAPTSLTKVLLNFGNPSTAINHLLLHDYIFTLAKEESFITCFERVCDEWPHLKSNWKSEKDHAEKITATLRKIC